MSSASRTESPNRIARALFAGLPERYDRLAAILWLGQDRRWRRQMIDHAVNASPDTILDVATGPAGVAVALARRTPARITGIDISNEMLSRARANVAAGGLASRI